MCQIENLKGVRRFRYPFQEVTSGRRRWRPLYRFDTRCLEISIDFNNYELYRMIIDSCDLTPCEILGVAVERGATEWMKSILSSGRLTSEDLSSSVGRQIILSAFNAEREDLALQWLEAGGDPNMVVDGCSLLQHAKYNFFDAFAKALIDAGVSANINADVEEPNCIGITPMVDSDIPHLTEITKVPLDEIGSDSDHSIIDTD